MITEVSTKLKSIETKAEFEAWPKIPRAILGDCVMTNKMDGTNACVIIEGGVIVGVQSRKRMLNVGKDPETKQERDNYGFASHVVHNKETFLALGEGRHYGEWAGEGIQKNPHDLTGKQFFLFNTLRWGVHNPPPKGIQVVEVLHHGEYTRQTVDDVMNDLLDRSVTEGWKAEGIVVYFPKIKAMEKHTFEYSKGKWTGA